jgi:hypothetical protein
LTIAADHRFDFSPVTSSGVRHVYLLLLLLHTLAASFIWGINTLFLVPTRSLPPA